MSPMQGTERVRRRTEGCTATVWPDCYAATQGCMLIDGYAERGQANGCLIPFAVELLAAPLGPLGCEPWIAKLTV
jgi:hypothetical protein